MIFFDFPPDFRKEFSYSFKHSTAIDRQLIGGEKRRSMASHFLREITLPFYLFDDDLQRAREWFSTQTEELVAVPDWMCSAEVAEVLSTPGDIRLEKWEGYDWRGHFVFIYCHEHRTGEFLPLEGVTDGVLELGSPPLLNGGDIAGLLVYPVRIGRMTKKPSLKESTDTHAEFSLTFAETIESLNESIPWTRSHSYSEYEGRKVFTAFKTDKTSSWENNISVSKAGFGKDTGYTREETPKRTLSFSELMFTREMVHDHLHFFDEHRGRAEGFWLPSGQCNLEIVSGGAGETVLRARLDDLRASHHVSRFGHVSLQCVGHYFFTSVSTVSEVEPGVYDLTLGDPLPHDYTRGAVQNLLYVRFSSDELKLSFSRSDWAETSLAFIELPREYQEQETGTRPIYLYRLEGYSDALFTSYGKPVEIGGETYLPADINHKQLNRRNESIQTQLSVDYATEDPDSPFLIFRRGYPAEEIRITVLKTYATDTSIQEIFYAGEVRKISYGKRNSMTFQLGSAGDFAEAEVPRAWAEPRCPRLFGQAGCEVDLTPLTFSSSVTVATLQSVTVSGVSAESLARGAADWFTHGVIRIGSQVRTITAVLGDQVFISTPFVDVSAEDAVELVPGCNRSLTHCVDRFNNLKNFGGSPYVPTRNPQMEAITLAANAGAGAGKK